jgi:hypothetical protein
VQLSRRISDALAEPAKTKQAGYLVWSPGRLTHPTGAAAMQCPSMKTAFEFTLRQMNMGDLHLIDQPGRCKHARLSCEESSYE